MCCVSGRADIIRNAEHKPGCLKLLNLPANNTMNCNLQQPLLAYITPSLIPHAALAPGNIHEAIPFYWVAIGATTAHRLCLPEPAPGLLKRATPGCRGWVCVAERPPQRCCCRCCHCRREAPAASPKRPRLGFGCQSRRAWCRPRLNAAVRFKTAAAIKILKNRSQKIPFSHSGVAAGLVVKTRGVWVCYGKRQLQV